MSEVARFLGVTRQQAYNRKKGESWSGIEDDGLVPSSTVKTSRDLERDKLLQRVDELDALSSKQQMSDAIEITKQEHNL